MRVCLSTALLLLFAALNAAAGPSAAAGREAASGPAESVCLMMESAARANDLPVEFFVRLIYQESSFRSRAVGPRTRRGDRAQGIAQFMPRTAAERRLLDPFDPVQALPKSAEFLRELRAAFGNLGLAAAAYNAGPKRVADWLAHRQLLPRETQHYVRAITGRPAEDWVNVGDEASSRRPQLACGELIAMLKRSPTPFVTELERQVAEGAMSPWGVQLSAGFSRGKALAAYAAIESRYRSVLAGTGPTLLRTVLRSRGSHAFYQVRVGAATREKADALCARIRIVGGACLVLRNMRGTPQPI